MSHIPSSVRSRAVNELGDPSDELGDSLEGKLTVITGECCLCHVDNKTFVLGTPEYSSQCSIAGRVDSRRDLVGFSNLALRNVLLVRCVSAFLTSRLIN